MSCWLSSIPRWFSNVLYPGSRGGGIEIEVSGPGGGRTNNGGTNAYAIGGLRRSGGVLNKARARTLRMTVVIVLVFIICWTPYYIITLW